MRGKVVKRGGSKGGRAGQLVTWYKKATRVKSYNRQWQAGHYPALNKRQFQLPTHPSLFSYWLLSWLFFFKKHVGPSYSWNYTPQLKQREKIKIRKNKSPVSDWTLLGPHFWRIFVKSKKFRGTIKNPLVWLTRVQWLVPVGSTFLSSDKSPKHPPPPPRRTSNAILPAK